MAQPELDSIVNARYWGEYGFPHEAMRKLRQTQPVWRYEGGVVDPFWLVTKRAEIELVSLNPKLWTSAARTTIEQPHGEPPRLRSVVQMDPPEHTKYRRILRSWLSPKNVRQLEARLAAISRELVDDLCEKNESDFVR